MNAHGLHSPLVYDLYTDILEKKKEFYSFRRINNLYNKKKDFCKKEAELLYQLLNKYGYRKGLIIGPGKESMRSIMMDISTEIQIQIEYKEESNFDFIHFCSNCATSDLNIIPLQAIAQETQFISLSQPHHYMGQELLWNELISNSLIRVTVDLWSMGICFPNNKQRKQHFILQNKHFQF